MTDQMPARRRQPANAAATLAAAAVISCLFSSASRVFTERRNRLAPKKADMLLFIKHNLALINFKY